MDVPYTETYIGQPSTSKSASVQTTTPFVRRTLTRCQPLLPLPSDSISKLCSSLVVPPTNEVSPLDCCCLFLQAPLPSPFAVNRSLSQERRPPLLPQTVTLEICEPKTFVPQLYPSLNRMSCLNMLLNTWYSPDLIPTVTPMTDPFQTGLPQQHSSPVHPIVRKGNGYSRSCTGMHGQFMLYMVDIVINQYE